MKTFDTLPCPPNWASLVAQMVKNLPVMQNIPGQEDPLERGMATHPIFLPGEFHGQRSLLGYSGWGCKELEMTEQLTHTHSHTHIQNWKSNVF